MFSKLALLEISVGKKKYFTTEFPIPPIKCVDCQRPMPGQQSYQITNSPQFIAFAIDRNVERLPLGGNITVTVYDSEYGLSATTQHIGHNLHVG